MQIKQDKFNLSESKIGKITGKGSDIRLDIQLDFNDKQINIGANIIGKVVDSNNTPIQGAVIKLVNGNLDPLTNTMTDANGMYSLASIEVSNIYKIMVIATGKILFQTEFFTLSLGENKTIDIILQSDVEVNFGAISGKLKNKNGVAIQGAIVLLYNIVNGQNNLIAITYTDNSGIFIFNELEVGDYSVVMTALGYLQEELTTNIESNKIASLSKILYENAQSAEGIISGIITDESNNVVKEADVILYRVDDNNDLFPVAFTKTNLSGVYSFINVPAGNYLVKSNQSKLFNISENPTPSYSIPNSITSITNTTLMSSQNMYYINFSTSNDTGNWTVKNGSANLSINNGNLNIATSVSTVIDENSPILDNGIFEATFKYTSNDENYGRIGLVFRYVDNNNWVAVSYDLNGWVWMTATRFENFGGNLPVLQVGKEYKVRLQYNNKTIILTISGNDLPDGAITMRQYIEDIPTTPGKIGFMNWYVDKNMQISEIALNKIPNQGDLIYIQSNAIKVALDSKYPRIVEYTWNVDGLTLDGEKEPIYSMEINDNLYTPDITSVQLDSKTILYTINLNTIQVVIIMKMYLMNDYTVKGEISEIKEEGSFKVKKLKFFNNLATVKNIDNGQIAVVINTGSWSEITDQILSVDEYAIGVFHRSYAFINNNKAVVGLSNNSFNSEKKYTLTVENRANYKQASLNNGLFIYRQIFDGVEYLEPLLWFEVTFGRDVNGNGIVDWQDGAILFRQNKKPIVGAEYIKDSISYIAYNTAVAQSPFLKTANIIKRIFNYTDGFGQLVQQKGYQGCCHDDDVCDLSGHIGNRQGGVDALNKSIEIASRYNARIGVHVNLTEYHLDSFQFKLENLIPGFHRGWALTDQSYYVDKRKELLSGEINRKFDDLQKELPGLKWIYVDVYKSDVWTAYKLATLLNEKGWMVATEYSGPFEEQVGWVHWGSDPSYTNKANTSKIIRFIRNGEQDAYLADHLLKASKHLFPSGWIEKTDIEGPHVIEMFYNQDLPSKYMQHFDIMEWFDDGTNGFVKFNNGLLSKRENGNINIYQDCKLIATTAISSLNWRGIGITTLFMPWPWVQSDKKPQKKVYHWNPHGGETTWEIPNMWIGVSKVKVYQLSALGRTYVFDIDVIDEKVTINAEAKTPYVIFPYDEIVTMDRIDSWGEGILIADPDFDSENITDNWIIETTAANTNHIQKIKENFEGRLGNFIVMVSGNNGANAILSQKLNGLTSNKTYTASVWVKLEGDRNVTLGVNCNNISYETNLTRKTTRIHRTYKWRNDTFTKMRVDFNVPSGVTTASLYLNIASDSKDSTVYFDDFYLWTNPLNSPPTNREGYVFYEDFENVDQAFGPLYSTIEYSYILQYESSGRRTSFAEKNPNGGQYMNWVINGRFSFKTNEYYDNTGDLFITDESTLKLKANTKYELGLKYTCKIPDHYYVSIKSDTSGEILKKFLQPGIITGNPEDGPNYHREIKVFKEEFITGNTDDCYLAIGKGGNFDELILDDIYIIEKDAAFSKTDNNIFINDIYISNYNNVLNNTGWNVESGLATISTNNGLLNIETTNTIVIDKNSPVVTNGIYTANFKIDSNEDRIGFIFRYVDVNNWVAISYDVNNWVWSLPGGQYGDFIANLPNLEVNKEYSIKIKYTDKNILVNISDGLLTNKIEPVEVKLPNIPVIAGRIGITSWGTYKNIQLNDISLIYTKNPYYEDFSVIDNAGVWQPVDGLATLEFNNNSLKINTSSSFVIAESSSLSKNGVFKVSFNYNSETEGRLGFIFRYANTNSWAAICYDVNKWIWSIAGNHGDLPVGLPNLEFNKQYNITIEYKNNYVSISLEEDLLNNGPISISTMIPEIPVISGKQGIISWYSAKNIIINKFSVEPIKDLYFSDFATDKNNFKWNVESGLSTMTIANGKLNLVTGISMIKDENSPLIINGIYKVSFKFSSINNLGRIGFMFRYVDVNNWCAISYDINSRWVWQVPGQNVDLIPGLPNLELDKIYVITIQYNNKNINVKIEGETIINKEASIEMFISNLPVNAGKIGLMNWGENKTIELDYVFLQDI